MLSDWDVGNGVGTWVISGRPTTVVDTSLSVIFSPIHAWLYDRKLIMVLETEQERGVRKRSYVPVSVLQL